MSGVADLGTVDDASGSDLVTAAQAALNEGQAEAQEDGAQESEAPEPQEQQAESQPAAEEPQEEAAPAEPPAKSRAEEIREAARARRAAIQEPQPAPQPQPDPLAQINRAEVERAIQFQRLFQANPIEAMRQAGHDIPSVYDKMTQEALAPGTTNVAKQVEELSARQRADAERIARQEQAFRNYQQGEQARQEHERYLSEMNAQRKSGDYRYVGKVDEGTLVRYALEEQDSFRREYGTIPSPGDLLELVEDRLGTIISQLGASETTKDTRATGEKVAETTAGKGKAQPLTNDLASQTASPAEVEHDPDAAYRQALKAASQIVWED